MLNINYTVRSLIYLKSTANVYVSRQFLIWLSITILALTSVISLFECIEKLRILMGRSDIALDAIIELSLLRLPQHLIDFMPFIFFIANLLALWKLNQNNEIIALRSAGVSALQLAFGCFITSVLMSIMCLIVLNPIAASCNGRYVMLEQKIHKQNQQSLVISSTGFWMKESTEKKRTIFHAKAFTLKEHTFHCVTLYEFESDDHYTKRIEAKNAELQDGKWHLIDVDVFEKGKHIHHYPMLDRPTDLTFQKIKEYAIPPNQIPFWRFKDTLRHLHKNGMSTLPYDLFWNRLWAEIALLGAMTVLAVGFCLKNPRHKGTASLVLMAVITGFCLHFLNKIIHAYGDAERLTPFWSAWIPPIVTLLLGIGYLIHSEETA